MLTNLDHFTGTEAYHSLRGIFTGVRMPYVATDGVHHVMENGGGQGAYWLVQAILSYQSKLMKIETFTEMQFWTLTVDLAKHSAVLTCDDGNGNIEITQKIEYTDFDLPEIKIWIEAGGLDPETPCMVLMLPSER